MDYSNEFSRYDNNSNEINHEEIYKKEIEDDLYDVKEMIDETNNRIELYEIFKCNSIVDNGDIIDCSNKNFQSINSLFKYDQLNDNNRLIELNSISINEQQSFKLNNSINELEKIDLKDFNPYEPSKSEENQLNIHSISEYSYENNSHISIFYIECCTTSTSLKLPQFVQNHIKSSNSFQQFWSPQVYSPKLIDSNTPENPLSILWSLIILLSKLILTGLKILQYDTILVTFCYFLGALFGMNAYFLIDFLLILICIISIFVSTYEQWFFPSVNLNEYDNETEIDNRYWKQIKLVAYGFATGIISTFII